MKIGDELKDGSIFAGIHPNGGYLLTQQHGITESMTWVDAEKYCKKNKGWSIPTIEELGILWAYKAKLGWYSAYYWSCDPSNENYMFTFGFARGAVIGQSYAHLGVEISHREKKERAEKCLTDKAQVRLVKKVDVLP
jgi:hypothetical protein